MASADRHTIMETNRSLRNIKTELENLLEKGVIDEAVFDTIHSALPQESPLSGPLRTATASSKSTSSHIGAAASPEPAHASPSNALPTQAMQNLNVRETGSKAASPAPPGYEETPPPGLPSRNAKPVIAHARALYRYGASDARDLSFERDDKIAVYERMNQDWWMGQNLRTGQEGIFPRNYVLEEADYKPPPGPMYAQPQYGYNGPPPQQNPYNAPVPPMAVAEGGQQPPPNDGGDNKVGQYGKKFGKKLGNAAIFGAGASIGSNIVNSIF
ncbi:hypothetical protein CDD81_7449 [Ophiocordyceps australis]|uniref:Class E vacuolar protein-sorting machinery protein HSE1 n=1 Tax=Ophiocordyceps australis TaxID=1399860 RepID=A0A2C5YHC9_9HYPO|nr:hypothetical protein CDD81_7449 [Ophiocordyceps australis]